MVNGHSGREGMGGIGMGTAKSIPPCSLRSVQRQGGVVHGNSGTAPRGLIGQVKPAEGLA